MHANIDQTTPRMVQAVAAVSRLAQQDHVLRIGCGMDHLVALRRNFQGPAGIDDAGRCILESLPRMTPQRKGQCNVQLGQHTRNH